MFFSLLIVECIDTELQIRFCTGQNDPQNISGENIPGKVLSPVGLLLALYSLEKPLQNDVGWYRLLLSRHADDDYTLSDNEELLPFYQQA